MDGSWALRRAAAKYLSGSPGRCHALLGRQAALTASPTSPSVCAVAGSDP